MIYIYIIVFCVRIYFERNTSLYVYYNRAGEFEPLFMLFDMLGLTIFFGTSTINVTWWYMTLAIMIIITMPILYITYKRVTYLLVPVAIILPLMVLQDNAYYASLLSTMILGICFAEEDVFEKIKRCGTTKKSKIIKLGICIVMIYISFRLCYSISISYSYPLCGILYPYICFEFIAELPGIRRGLKFLGKHSMNIFMVHTIIYYYYFAEYIYAFKYDILILLVLLAVSIFVSWLIESLKKITNYDKWSNKCINRVDAYFKI